MGKCFLYGNGGGISRLKLQIYGGLTAPTNPKEHTIWVKTETPITQWILTKEADAWAELAGSVVIVYEASHSYNFSDAEIDVYNGKLNGIYGQWWMRLLYCYQSNGSGLKSVDAYVYVNGSWVQFSSTRIYLTNGSDKCFSLTGGWSEIRWYWDSYATGNVPTANWTDNGVVLTAPRTPGPGGLIVTKNAINLTNASSITINCADVSANSWCIISKATGDSFNANEVARVQLANGTNVLDVSGVAGSVYVGLVAYYQAKVTIKQTYMS